MLQDRRTKATSSYYVVSGSVTALTAVYCQCSALAFRQRSFIEDYTRLSKVTVRWTSRVWFLTGLEISVCYHMQAVSALSSLTPASYPVNTRDPSPSCNSDGA